MRTHRAILHITTDYLKDLLQIPAEAEIDGIEIDFCQFNDVKSNSLPAWLAPHVSIDTNSWMIQHGHSEYDSSTVIFPMAGYKTLICSIEQAEELQKWLDRVCPDWESKIDGYGNACVKISEFVRDPLENIVSPETRGDYV